MRPMSPPMRAVLGFLAGVISVLVFHQGAWALFYVVGLMPPPYPMWPVAPWGVPATIDYCFWGGLYGLLYGLLAPKLTMAPWLSGLIMGVIAALVLWFVVAPIKGEPLANGWVPQVIVVVLLIHLAWGIGVGLTMQLLTPGMPRRT